MNKAPSEPALAPANAPRRLAFWIGVALFVLWLAGLVTLVVTSSNPVTLNVRQLEEADSVVTARLTDAETGEFALTETIQGDEPPETFRVLRFDQIAPPGGDLWLMPLQREREGVYSIVEVPYRDRKLLLVYPGNDDTIAQARAALEIE